MNPKAGFRALVAMATLTLGIAALPGVASAHHPIVTGTTQCRTGDTWTVTWVARADAARGLTWQITSPSGYTPAGAQVDTESFARTRSYPTTQASATETVSARWSNGNTGVSTSDPVTRPPACQTPTTTTTTTTAPPSPTTTVPAPTTTPPPATTVPDATTTTTTPPPDAETTTVPDVAVDDPPVPTTPPEPTDPTPAPTAPPTPGGSLPATGAARLLTLTLIAIGLVAGGRALTRIAR